MIENVTELTVKGKNAVRKINFFNTTLPASIVLILIVAISEVLLCLLKKEIVAVALFLIVFFCFAVFILSSVRNNRQVKKNITTGIKKFQKYVFYDDYIFIEFESEDVKGRSVVKYDVANRIVETDSYFMLFTNKTMAYVIDKNGFIGGTQDELKILLKSKIKNYKRSRIKE